MKYAKLYEFIEKVCKKLRFDEQLEDMFRKCFLNTLETTVQKTPDGGVFVITGDIAAMWLRDSSVQVSHYVRLAGQDEDVRNLIAGLLRRQFGYICIDPYANAFLPEPSGRGWKDKTQTSEWIWERKFEIDSLVYPFWLYEKYYRATGDASVLGAEFLAALEKTLSVFENEQHHAECSPYTFERPGNPADSLENGGKGGACAYTGMVFSAFRPSDDRCRYGYLIPSNMFLAATFAKLSKLIGDPALAARCNKLVAEVREGIGRYAVVEHPEYGKMYAFETDGLGNYNLMDDANVPNLLGMPYYDFCEVGDELYANTRRFVLSKDNPYYFEGKYAKGLGSPHTPDRYIWHIGLIMQGLTSTDKAERARILRCLTETTAQTNYMHEGFDCDDPAKYSRSWFAWANTLFAVFVLENLDEIRELRLLSQPSEKACGACASQVV